MAHSKTSAIEAACARHNHRADALIEILHDVQHAQGCIDDEAARVIADKLNLSRADVQGVRSFYTDFIAEARRKTPVKICRAEACQAVGSDKLAAALETAGHDLETIFCLGNCALGPAVMVEDRLIGRATAERVAAQMERTK
ncbi:MAG: NAD(P)H-dependent oxidoreductase subunit E [Maricaulis sp.]|nr:NAD(P)H-dependent oxidoreductase subunit E [Maricaulis sp.]